MEVKQALKDHRFRDSLPEGFKKEVVEFLQNPGCPCNVPLYKRILKEAREQLLLYFPEQEIVDVDEEMKKLTQNRWTVINCSILELESKLAKLPPGRKQIDVARFGDQVTVVVNELEIVY